MFPKKIRVVNLTVLNEVRKKSCAACGKPGPSHAHHIKTRGSGGDDVPENLLPLCFKCHNEIHQLGATRFKAKWIHLQQYKDLK